MSFHYPVNTSIGKTFWTSHMITWCIDLFKHCMYYCVCVEDLMDKQVTQEFYEGRFSACNPRLSIDSTLQIHIILQNSLLSFKLCRYISDLQCQLISRKFNICSTTVSGKHGKQTC